jgi:hypothetical protein
LYVRCPNKGCNGKFLRDQVKKSQKDDEIHETYREIVNHRLNEDIREELNESVIDPLIYGNSPAKANTNRSSMMTVAQASSAKKIINPEEVMNTIANANNDFISPVKKFNPTENYILRSNQSNISSNESFKKEVEAFQSDASFSKKQELSNRISNANMSRSMISKVSYKTATEKTRECPVCGIPVDLSNQIGDLVKCLSCECKGRYHFCKKCNVKLSEDEKINHFLIGQKIRKCANISLNNSSIINK